MKRLPNFLLMMLTAVLLATFITSCSESGSDSDPSSPTQPQTPISDGDWQTIPVSGGTIEKDSITITFPNGTFSKDTKVAVTEMKKGEIGGKYEVSKFYQMTFPATTGAPITLSIKAAKADNNVCIIHSQGYIVSTGDAANTDIELETTYSNGSYKATLPAVNNGEDPENVYISVGLVNLPDFDGAQTRGTKLIGGQVNNVKWQIKTSLSAWLKYNSSTLNKAYNYSSTLNDYIKTTLTKIFDLGFKISGDRTVYVYYGTGDDWGGFIQSKWTDNQNCIELGLEKILNAETSQTEIKQTVIHEFLHFFQSDYDTRWTIQKGNPFQEGGYILTISEMAAVWIEHLMDPDLQLNADFLMKYIKHPIQLKSGLTLTEVPEAWSLKNNRDAYQNQGYITAPLLYYLCSQKKFETFGLNNKSVVEMHDIWKKYVYNTQLGLLDDWIWDEHKLGLLIGHEIDDYYLDLFLKKIVKGFNLYDVYDKKDYLVAPGLKKIDDRSCYPYGCSVYRAYFQTSNINSLKDKEIVIKQETKGMQTYLIWSSDNKEKYELLTPEAVGAGDSIVISGEKIISMTGKATPSLYLITTRVTNSTLDHGKKDFVATIELRDKEQSASVNPTELTYTAEGGTQTVTVYSKEYSRYNHTISDKYKEWLSAKNNPAGKMDITVQPNATGKERIGYVRVYVFNDENPTEAQKVYLKDSIKVTQAANKEPEQQESAYELVGGGVNMYYAVEWRSEIEFKDGDDRVTITPSGKGAKVQIQQSGEDTGRNAEWEYTLSFDVDDLSLYDSKQAKISNFKYEFYKEGKGYDYYGNHVDWEKSETLMTSNAPMQQTAYGNWRFESQDLSYYGLSITHFDKYRTDPYSSYTEHTDKSETKEMTPGSNVTIWLTIKKK